ncbi:MAG TPA: transketolase [Holosporales bacterium]|nr:transketolase [Holosporales bacterium]
MPLPINTLQELSNCLRFLSIDMVEKAESGHPGMPMGMADAATVLFKDFLRYNPKNPSWKNRDRFVLSGGHGSALLYSLLHLTGYNRPTIEDLKKFRQLGSPCAGHPEFGELPGIEATTGPLGQGIANAVGMAIAAKKRAAEDAKHFNYKIYVTCGDGDLMEGISHEACALAGHLNLNNLIILFDDNQITIDGPKNLSDSEDVKKRFEAYGFNVLTADGHDFKDIHHVLTKAQSAEQPTFIACKTVIGKGSPSKEGTSGVHGSPLGETEIAKTRIALKWPHPPFFIPENLRKLWLTIGKRCDGEYDAWSKTYTSDRHNTITNVQSPLTNLKIAFLKEQPNLATRQVSQMVLDCVLPVVPNLIGGSADLTPSNNTHASGQKAITRDDFTGSYIHYGIREHAMGAIMNGLSLSGYKPYGGTFLTFSDYMRPAIRLSALMKQSVIYVMTHDSIGLGEDGPTHQPIEHISSLRAMPNVNVFRPCDALEALECWELALTATDTPSVLALSRQKLPFLRKDDSIKNLSKNGAYILRNDNTDAPLDVTLIGTGSEVSLCVEAKIALAAENINARVVSMPCQELFNKLPVGQQSDILGKPKTIIAVEAGTSYGWDRYIYRGQKPGTVIGINQFGASAPASDLFKHFEITVQRIVDCFVQQGIES